MTTQPLSMRVRGIRQSIPQGYILGRSSSGSGDVELLPLSGIAVSISTLPAMSNAGQWKAGVITSVSTAFTITSSVLHLAQIPSGEVLGNSSGGAAEPAAATLTALLDLNFGNVEGMILYRDASAWKALGAGTSGNFLKTQGTVAPPVWSSTPDNWNAGTVSTLGGALAINSGTISDQHQGTITATGTGTINPANIDSCIVNMGTVNTTLTVSPGFQGQRLRLEIKQGATAHTVAFDSTVTFGASIPSYTASTSPNLRDIVQLFCLDGTHWAFAAVNQGFTI